MQSLKIIRRRIQSVKNTQKITKAMKLVAAAKLLRAQRDVLNARFYTERLHKMVKELSLTAGPESPPLMHRRHYMNSFDVFAVTSERGLCGSFNEDLLNLLMERTYENTTHGIKIYIYVVGKKGWEFLSDAYPNVERADVAAEKLGVPVAKYVSDLFVSRFLSGKSDGSFIVFNRFESAVAQKVVFWNYLPFYWHGTTKQRTRDCIYEPDKGVLVASIVRALSMRSIEHVLIESKASEFAARMRAMDNATRNAEEVIEHLTLEYNKARQASITTELLDIMGGAEALQ